ncbi:MAG: transcription-repair coupling factor [Selenomonadaceae bacterium]|nr:transcription-repair coupling factor [Selenomonadaceae bacterium]
MHKILEAALRDEVIRDVASNFARHKEFLIYGLAGTQKTVALAAAFAKNPRPTIIIVSDREKISGWQNDLAELLPETAVEELPELDLFDIRATAGVERRAQRLEILMRLYSGEKFIVLATTTAAVKKDFSRKDFLTSQLKISVGQNLRQEDLIAKLVDAGYERADDIDAVGKFSVRGGIVDIFPINAPKPCRIEFFDDVIDSMREISAETLRSEKNIESATVLPVFAADPKKAEPFTTCAADGAVIFDEPARIREEIENLVKEDEGVKPNIFTFEQLIKNSRGGCLIYIALMLKKIRGAELTDTFGLTATNVASFQNQLEFFAEEIKRQSEVGRKIFALFSAHHKLDQIKNLLAEKNLTGAVELEIGTLTEGFVFPTAQLTVITEKDIFGSQVERRRMKSSASYAGDTIKNFTEIKVGDYVVHAANGIGKYLGVDTLEFDGVKRDYLHIQYGGGDKLYLPTDSVRVLQKYISDDETVPHLSKLGTGEWARAKSRAASAVEDIAEKLIEIYARRSAADGFAFDVDDVTQADFEEKFPYEETPDQIKAVEDVKADMERETPMDRLICGDVGFGKTEIAIRAAYKAAMNGKQVAILVPTTVLAQQHFQTFSERLAGFLPVVDVICRFRTPKEQRITMQKVRAGQVDILIGTHAILNSKIEFKDLGLIIIDEEQRFGVKQKEKIRSISDGVDILAMSATPIPRTLHMSLVSARDMSLITTPPADRFPVQTYVIEDDDAIIAEAIRREIKRGGQVYFVYNRIETIELMRAHLEKLVPEAQIQVGHGQQSDAYLENIMMDFYEGKFNVLLCTTIIENGLDVANANTIIIYDADNFGLAQLYQMRGRVGRSHQMAFAYFVHRQAKVMTENAEKRLHAMKEFAQLGAGFKIAMRDLEIRGAGNLLGAQQHGHIASVGFEMYCQLLNDAVSKLQNKPVKGAPPEPTISLNVEAYIDDNYIPNSMHKIEIYQRLAVLRDDTEVNDLLDELIDRFGEPTEPVMNLLKFTRIKCAAKKIGLLTLQMNALTMELQFGKSVKISPAGFNFLTNKFGEGFKFSHESKSIFIRLETKKNLLDTALMVLKRLEG